MVENTRIVLVKTSHPGNIGSVARAMKTMGFFHLYLVAPQHFPDHKAIEMASGAIDVLDNAIVVDTLIEAISDCALVIGTSARTRTIPWPVLSPRELGEKICNEQKARQTALVFGCEQFGLTNKELEHCHWHVQIPANPAYSSLNLAAAVQILTYELSMGQMNPVHLENAWDFRLANADEMERLFLHMQETLTAAEFLKPTASRKLMTRLRRLLLRARPDIMEINILRGMLSAFQHAIDEGNRHGV